MTDLDLYLLLSRHMSSGQARLPAFDRTGFFVTQEMARDHPDLRNIEKLILQDPALSAHLLRAANSAYYRGLQEVTTARQAMVRLGLVEVANIVIMLSQRNTFTSSEPFIREQMHDLWIHSVACAQASAWLAKETGHPSMVHSAFFAGLLHDIGKAFMLIAVGDLYAEKKFPEGVVPSQFEKAIDDAHAAIGARLLTQWDIPAMYADVSRRHHDIFFAAEDYLITVVSLANKILVKNGIGLRINPDLDLENSFEVAMLGITKDQLLEIDVVVENYLSFVAEVV
jgi:HD-like signal output (HDOD) protein